MARILLALDGSADAEEAIPQARQYCGPDDELVLLRVAASLPTFTQDELRLDAYLSDVASRLRESGVKVSTQTRFGHADEQIVEAAREADLVILHSHAHGWRRLVFGSVSERVARRAPCPVLIK